MDELTETEQAVLDFERLWWRSAGRKESAILETFGWSATRYYQVLNALLEKPGAVAADPMTVRRLQRMRSARKAARSRERLLTYDG